MQRTKKKATKAQPRWRNQQRSTEDAKYSPFRNGIAKWRGRMGRARGGYYGTKCKNVLGGEGKGGGIIKIGKGKEMWDWRRRGREKDTKGGRADGAKKLAIVADCHVWPPNCGPIGNGNCTINHVSNPFHIYDLTISFTCASSNVFIEHTLKLFYPFAFPITDEYCIGAAISTPGLSFEGLFIMQSYRILSPSYSTYLILTRIIELIWVWIEFDLVWFVFTDNLLL